MNGRKMSQHLPRFIKIDIENLAEFANSWIGDSETDCMRAARLDLSRFSVLYPGY
jgi:hypothetical protein